MTIADRRRELGVLQAVGGLRRQVRRAVWMEAATLAVVCVVLGLGLGALHLYFVLQISERDYPGLHFDYTYPYGIALSLFPVMIVGRRRGGDRAGRGRGPRLAGRGARI